MNIYFLAGQANNNFEADNSAVLGADIDGVLVECSPEEAGKLSTEWGLKAPLLAADGVYYSESGDVVYVAHGEQVSKVEKVAEALGWDRVLDAEDYLRTIMRVY